MQSRRMNVAKVKVTRNYQITLPRDVRKKMGIEEGDYVSIEPINNTTAVMKRFLPIEDLAGAWDEEMDRIMEDVRKLWKTWKL